MGDAAKGWTLGEIASATGCKLVGSPDLVIRRPVPAGTQDPEGITFAASNAYIDLAMSQRVGAVVCGQVPEPRDDRAFLLTDDPRSAFGTVLGMFARALPRPDGIHPTALVAKSAKVAEGARVGAYSIVEEDATVAEGAIVHPFCYVGPRCVVGPRSVLNPRVTLVQDVTMGAGCLVHSGAVIGAEGFGFVWDGEKQVKIPQVGGVTLGDGVEVGANTAVDRATCGTTTLEDGVKLDNLVQIGHNSSLGRHTVVAAQSGLSGSVAVGGRVQMGGQVGIADHVRIADGVLVGGGASVLSSIDEPGQYLGYPHMGAKAFLRLAVLLRRLPGLFDRVRKLEDDNQEPGQ